MQAGVLERSSQLVIIQVSSRSIKTVCGHSRFFQTGTAELSPPAGKPAHNEIDGLITMLE